MHATPARDASTPSAVARCERTGRASHTGGRDAVFTVKCAAVLLLYLVSMHATAQHLGSSAMEVEEGTARRRAITFQTTMVAAGPREHVGRC